jgi:hypothetical protein
MSHSSHADRVLPMHPSSPGSWVAVLPKLIERLICKLTTGNGLVELRAMDDRLLTDIGLTRQQIEYVARHGRWPTVEQSRLRRYSRYKSNQNADDSHHSVARISDLTSPSPEHVKHRRSDMASDQGDLLLCRSASCSRLGAIPEI